MISLSVVFHVSINGHTDLSIHVTACLKKSICVLYIVILSCSYQEQIELYLIIVYYIEWFEIYHSPMNRVSM